MSGSPTVSGVSKVPAAARSGDFWGRMSHSRWGLVLLYLVATLLPVLVLGFFIHSLMFTLLKNKSTDTLIAKGQYAAAILQQQLEETALAGNLLARAPELAAAIKLGETGPVAARLDNIAGTMAHRGIASVAVMDQEGVIQFATRSAADLVKTPCLARNRFVADEKTGALILRPVAKAGEAEGAPAYVWAFPLPGDSSGKGSLSLVLYPAPDFLARRLAAVSTEQDVRCYVVDSTGLLLWHSNTMPKKPTSYATRPEVMEMLAGRQGVYEGQDPDSGRNTVSMHIPTRQGVGVVVSTTKAAVYRGLDEMFLVFMVMLIVLTLLAIVSALLGATVLADTQKKSRELAEKNQAMEKEISERRKVEDALQKSREEFQALVQNTSDWFWEIDAEGTLTYASARVADLLAYWPEEIMGKKLSEFLAPEEKEQFEPLYVRLVEKQQPFAAMPLVHRHKDGHRVILESSGTPVIDGFGKAVGFRGITRVPPRH